MHPITDAIATRAAVPVICSAWSSETSAGRIHVTILIPLCNLTVTPVLKHSLTVTPATVCQRKKCPQKQYVTIMDKVWRSNVSAE